MTKYIKLFNTTSEYNAYTADTANFVKPNVSLCKDNPTVILYKKYDYYDRYLTFIAREQGTFTLTIGSAVTTSILSSISYSINDGETWTTTNNVNSQTVTITTPTINQGGKVLWKGNGVGISTTTNNSNRPSTSSIFSSSGKFDAEGNILSLVWGDEFGDKDYVAEGSSYNFACMFYANTGHVGTNYAKIVSAKNMCISIKNVPEGCFFRMFQETQNGTVEQNTLTEIPSSIAAESVGVSACSTMFFSCTSLTTVPSGLLPATTLAKDCYYGMFQLCSSLTTVPSGLLLATTLAEGCYRGMFAYCSSLTTVPSDLLPATTLANNCYNGMFENCPSLTTVLELPATTLASTCYQWMFAYCSSLTSIPSGLLPATTLASDCYYCMFYKCTSLTTVPSGLLPATTLTEGCYQWMFAYCSSLTTVPSDLLLATTLTSNCYQCMFQYCSSLTTVPSGLLPATTLAEGCYKGMFQYCSSLTTALELPATTLVKDCYRQMFEKCTNLNSITMLATNISATDCLTNWVNDVAANGTFTKATSMTTLPSGANGIPANWTVVNAS